MELKLPDVFKYCRVHLDDIKTTELWQQYKLSGKSIAKKYKPKTHSNQVTKSLPKNVRLEHSAFSTENVFRNRKMCNYRYFNVNSIHINISTENREANSDNHDAPMECTEIQTMNLQSTPINLQVPQGMMEMIYLNILVFSAM